MQSVIVRDRDRNILKQYFKGQYYGAKVTVSEYDWAVASEA